MIYEYDDIFIMSSKYKDSIEKAKELRKQGIAITKIASELKISKSTIFSWTKNISISNEQKRKLLHREIKCIDNSGRLVAISKACRNKRVLAQERGREKIKSGNILYVAGCMLYWGEGNKQINQCRFSNSELPMMILFKSFLEEFFNISSDEISIVINAYTDLHSQKEIENYWLNGLKLPQKSLKKCTWNKYPSSSKKKNINKSKYGTCSLIVNKTEIVQEIFGAIQEFGKFNNEKWLNKG